MSKVLPSHGSRAKTIAACERSLRRLCTDRIDLYLLHWRSATRLEETVEGFHELERAGKIRHWGVSMSAIPKAGTPAHVEENRAALDLRLSAEDLAELDRAFPRPARKVPLEML